MDKNTRILRYAAQHEFFIEWTATAFLIVGVALTSFNVFPLNLAVSMLGNVGWLFVGILWRKWSLIVIQVILTIIYVSGLANHYLT
jgi:hypothetical protein